MSPIRHKRFEDQDVLFGALRFTSSMHAPHAQVLEVGYMFYYRKGVPKVRFGAPDGPDRLCKGYLPSPASQRPRSDQV